MARRYRSPYLRGFRGFPGLLRRIADRFDPAGAPRLLGYRFTFELGEGIRFRDDGRGCQLWYLGEENYLKAHEEADNPPPRIEWHTGLVFYPRGPRDG